MSALVQERGDNNDQVELLEGLEADDSEAARMAQEASVVKLVNEILIEAANERASDIHIECEESGLKIRYRIDGILQTQNFPFASASFPWCTAKAFACDCSIKGAWFST